MKTVYDFFVYGIPKAQPRPRMTKTGHVYTPDSAQEWKETVSDECLARRRPIIMSPVKLTVTFYFPVPKTSKRLEMHYPHTVKHDSDNLLKAVMDAMTDARVWKDDALVFAHKAEKWYSKASPGAQIKVEVTEDL